jgi:hypothetical protein
MNKDILVVLGVVALLCLATSKEKFSLAGYSKPILDVEINKELSGVEYSQYDEKQAHVSPDTLQEIIFTIQRYMESQGVDWTYAIETNDVKKFVNKTDPSKVVYKCRFMFMYTKGFPFGFGVTADIMMAPKPTVIGIQTQPMANQTKQPISPFNADLNDNFVNYQQIVKSM